MRVTELRQRLHEFAVTYRVDTVETRKEDIDAMCQAFATFLEELELPEKEEPLYGDGWEDWNEGHLAGRNDSINETRTLIQAQVKELRKI